MKKIFIALSAAALVTMPFMAEAKSQKPKYCLEKSDCTRWAKAYCAQSGKKASISNVHINTRMVLKGTKRHPYQVHFTCK
ncbi:MAG: hypothetical protein ACK5LE_03125 [Alphaproteobacteria bacterium]